MIVPKSQLFITLGTVGITDMSLIVINVKLVANTPYI